MSRIFRCGVTCIINDLKKKNTSGVYYNSQETKKNFSPSPSVRGREYVLGWKSSKVLDWLGSIGMSKYGALFAEHQMRRLPLLYRQGI